MSDVHLDLAPTPTPVDTDAPLWVVGDEDREQLPTLAGLERYRRLVSEVPLATLRAAIGAETVLVDPGRDAARDRRVLAALASGARVVAIEASPLMHHWRAEGAALFACEDDPAALRAALLLAREDARGSDLDLARDLERIDAWLADDESVGPAGVGDGCTPILFGFDPDDRHDRERRLAEFAAAHRLVVGTRREPAAPGEGVFEAALGDAGYGLVRRAHGGAGRRIDLYERRGAEG